MARSVQQIQREITSLEENVNDLARELYGVYRNYLASLGECLTKQLVLAGYQICTHIYPEAFLKLSFSQRQQLQRSLQKIARNMASKLTEVAEESIKPVVSHKKNLIEQMLENLSLASEGESQAVLELSEDVKAFFLTNKPEAEKNEDNSDESQEQEESSANLLPRPELIKNPEDLIQWYKHIEEKIDQAVKNLSKEANHQLKEQGILPSKLPGKFLDMALQAEEASPGITGPPHLLNLLIEMESREGSSDVSQITVICLRLSEVEYSDGVLTSLRHQIRNILGNLSKIHKQYQQKQKEKAIAEAEAAWRASWYEDV